MNWLTFDIVNQSIRTHVYSVPQGIFIALGPTNVDAILSAKTAVIDALKERHPGCEVHEGEPVGLDVGDKKLILARLGISEVDLAADKPVYEPGTPERLEVLCVTVDSDITDPWSGRKIGIPRAIFPDHPQYAEVREALRTPAALRPTAAPT